MRAGSEPQAAGGAEGQGHPQRLCGSSPRLLCGLILCLLLFPAVAAAAGSDPLRELGLQAPNEQVDGPEFSLSDLTGRNIHLKDFRGKLILLNFFATWCHPCREEMPGMERLFRSHRAKGFVVVAVNLQEGATMVRPFVEKLKLSFPIVLDAEGTISREYGVRALPVTFLIGRDGKILWRAIGGRDWESAEARTYFAQLVTEKK
jgi:peroxiredoxin